MNKKEELKLKFETWVALDNDEEMRKEIIKLGQEKYEAFLKDEACRVIDGFDIDERDKITIYFLAYYYGEDNTELVITIDELFSDTKEWVKIKEERIEKAKKEREKIREEKEKQRQEAFEKGQYDLYLELEKKYNQIQNKVGQMSRIKI